MDILGPYREGYKVRHAILKFLFELLAPDILTITSKEPYSPIGILGISTPINGSHRALPAQDMMGIQFN